MSLTLSDEFPKTWFGRELMRESENLLAETKTGYHHREARGALREKVFREFLNRKLPNTLSAGKGEVGDSDCHRTSEFDIVVFDPAARLVLAEAADGRQVFPVESVRAVIEVRTRIDVDAVRSASQKADEFSGLRRYLCPTHMARAVRPLTRASIDLDVLGSGTGNDEPASLIPRIPTYLVGYDLAGLEAVADEFSERSPRLDGVLVVGNTFLQRASPTEARAYPLQNLALACFMLEFIYAMQLWRERDNWFVPNWRWYLQVPSPTPGTSGNGSLSDDNV